MWTYKFIGPHFSIIGEESPHGIVANVLGYDIKGNSNPIYPIMFIFRLIPLGKLWNTFFPDPHPPMGCIVPLLFFYDNSFGIR